MSQLSETQTIRYYDDHCEEYVRGTVDINMESLYAPFLDLLPKGGAILDAGCGSGRDSKAFLELGYKVTSIDASTSMVAATARLTGREGYHLRFQDIEYQSKFAGIWACASLLHVPRREIDDILDRLVRALQPSGVCYMSFKEGTKERQAGPRRFTDFTVSGLEACLCAQPDLEVVRIWTTDDLRPTRTERRVNALARKRSL